MTLQLKAQKFSHNNIDFFLTLISAEDLTKITYVARRGVDQEQGAIQRILNKSRIRGIRDFLLDGGFFPNNLILNVIEDGNLLFDENTNTVSLSNVERIAQLIDGQHRAEGLKEAIKNDENIKYLQIPVVLSNNITTELCAEIFISINTEQKTVPKSLIYDLYGLMNISSRDYSIARGTDIATKLNQEDNSPYQGYIKFPGARKFKGGIQLSTFVNTLKPLVKTNGEFQKYSLSTLENQIRVLINYFSSIQSCYGENWYSLKNPFIYASGFSASIELFIERILPYCYSKKVFTEEYFKEIVRIPNDNIILQAEVKGLSGEAARNVIKNRFTEFLNIATTTEDDFEI